MKMSNTEMTAEVTTTNITGAANIIARLKQLDGRGRKLSAIALDIDQMMLMGTEYVEKTFTDTKAAQNAKQNAKNHVGRNNLNVKVAGGDVVVALMNLDVMTPEDAKMVAAYLDQRNGTGVK